ncbi:MAG: hypothetical protein IJ634_04235 [Bacteroidales bacterium]|nr:hypothetical protein [Bacteroidales bacterium]
MTLSSPAWSQDTNTVFLHIDGTHFFIDNEYFGDRVSGYTLPGFVLRPKVEWRLHESVTLTGGVHWLHMWGAKGFPSVMTYGAYPDYSDTASSLHLLPWMQATVKFSPQLKLVMGNLEAGHGLPEPLYNFEQGLAGDPEAGIQLTSWGRWHEVDIWADWREYIWNLSPRPERFTGGLSGELRMYWIDWKIYLPVHFVGQHEGGQRLAFSHRIKNNFNAAAGLGVSKPWGEASYWDLSCRLMWYHQRGNDSIPFTTGWGIYPELKMTLNYHWLLSLSYWHGENFVPLMGSWHFSNLSANTAGLTFDRTRVATLHAGWYWDPGWRAKASLYLFGTLYHYLPSTGTFSNGTSREYGHRNQIAFGAVLSFHPTIRLY